MTNNYDSAYDEIPECCCDGMEENDRLDDLLERLTAIGPKCHAVSASETHEVVDAVLELQRENAELKAMVNELRTHLNEAGSSSWWLNKADELVTKTPQQSLHDHNMRIADKVRDGISSEPFWDEEDRKFISNISVHGYIKDA